MQHVVAPINATVCQKWREGFSLSSVRPERLCLDIHFYAARWINNTSQHGPWSDIESAFVP